MTPYLYIPLALLLLLGGFLLWRGNNSAFPLPKGETQRVSDIEGIPAATKKSSREVLSTDGVRHSIPLNEILSGGPGKDGIPSIDSPLFISRAEADKFLNDTDPGIGLDIAGESRFYPYRILVWHEIANDTVQGKPILVTYCPLCATGIVFERAVDDVAQEFGVSGKLWQSNLLMYNRAVNEKDESLWSQVLGEAVVGVHTGKKLAIVPSDIIRWGDWKKLHPDTKVLSTDAGTARDYGRDPYGDYYTSESVSFGANFRDTRLHPKALIVGIEMGGAHKAYSLDALPTGEFTDSFAGASIAIKKDSVGRISISADGNPLPHVPSFWFSWLAVHPKTELYQ